MTHTHKEREHFFVTRTDLRQRIGKLGGEDFRVEEQLRAEEPLVTNVALPRLPGAVVEPRERVKHRRICVITRELFHHILARVRVLIIIN